MDATKLKYPYGRCAKCGAEFNADLRHTHNIQCCPWCGFEIDDHLSTIDSTQEKERENDIYCESCGRRIYERVGKGGMWIDKGAGVCSGPCERELCGNCGEWDAEGCCPECHKPDPDCLNCPKEDCENPSDCKSPCSGCPTENVCFNENTDIRHMCDEFLKFQEECKVNDPCDACGVHSEVGCRGCLKK